MDKETYLKNLNHALTSVRNQKYVDACLSYASRLLDNDLPVIFDKNHFALLIGVNLIYLNTIMNAPDRFYQRSLIPKKSGGERELLIPAVSLKYIQRWILDNILIKTKVAEQAYGFCKNKSILLNAKQHINKPCIVNIDIQDFFPSVTIEQVFKVFKYYGYTKEISYTLSKICTYNGYLPQGSPASPYLSNSICLKLDKRLLGLSYKYHATYTRYADDITFSGCKSIVNIIPLAEQILKDEGFKLNQRKTRISYNYQMQMVTGLIVNNQSVRVPKKYKRQLQQEIYYCKKFGVYNHQKKINDTHCLFKEHLYGKAYYIKMVEPEVGMNFLRLLDEITWDY